MPLPKPEIHKDFDLSKLAENPDNPRVLSQEGARKLAASLDEFGMLEAIVANRVRGIRCGVCWNEQAAIWSRAHNDANVLSIGQRTISRDLALTIVKVWLATPFEGGRHLRRILKIDGA